MRWFRNLRIRAKLISGFAVAGLIAAVIGTVGIVNIGRITMRTGICTRR